MGHDYSSMNFMMPLNDTITRKETERLEWLPVKISKEGRVKPIIYHGSAHINSLNKADGLISMNIGVTEIPKGTCVSVRLI